MTSPTILRAEIDRLRDEVAKLDEKVDAVVGKVNMIMGGIGALSIVALINLATNIVQAASKAGVGQ